VRRAAIALAVFALATVSSWSGPTASDAGAKPKKPQPTSLVRNLYDRADADDWTLGEGLVATLEFANGEASRRDVSSRRLEEVEITGVAEAARAYVDTPKTRPQEKRIRELLGDLIPTPAELRALAGDGTATSSFRGPAGGEIDCAELWRGEPDALPGRCLRVFDLPLDDGLTGLVYTPLEGVPPEDAARYEELVREALPIAWQTFGELGAMPNADIVFDPRSGGGHAVAGTALDETGARCVIMIRPFALDESNDDAKFILAHEAFHCFQGSELQSYRVSGEEALWWKEGSANYFANVVHPTVNTEYEKLAGLRPYEPGHQLLELDYDAFPFWQHLANTQGDAQAVALLRHLSERGKAADWPGMPELFHSYAEAFLTNGIIDSGGGAIPINAREENQGRFRPTEPGRVYQIVPRPFVIERAVIEWEAEREFDLETEQVGTIRVSAQEQLEGAWGALPDPVDACEAPRAHRVLTTALDRDAGRYRLDVVDVAARDADTGCCPGGSKPCIIVNGLRDTPSVYVGGICYVDDGFLTVAAGYDAYDASTLVEQDSPYPRGYVFILGIAEPGTELAGKPDVSITDGTRIVPELGTGATLTKAPDLLTGTFTGNGISGEYYCPALTPLAAP